MDAANTLLAKALHSEVASDNVSCVLFVQGVSVPTPQKIVRRRLYTTANSSQSVWLRLQRVHAWCDAPKGSEDSSDAVFFETGGAAAGGLALLGGFVGPGRGPQLVEGGPGSLCQVARRALCGWLGARAAKRPGAAMSGQATL